MKKTINFDNYIKESHLTPLEEEEEFNPYFYADTDEDEDEDLEDENALDDIIDSDNDGEADAEFELDAVPAEEPMLEPEENLGDDNAEDDAIEEIPDLEEIDLEEPVSDEVDLEEPMDDVEMGLDMDTATGTDQQHKAIFLYGGVNSVDDLEESSFQLAESIIEQMSDCECKMFKLYQLNIQPVSDTEPADGMQMIYDEISDADIVVIVSPIKSGNISNLTNLVMDRFANYYQNNELNNKVFGSILVGDSNGYQNIKSDLINSANNLGMIVAPNGNIFAETSDAEYVQDFVDSVSKLRDATAEIRQTVVDAVGEESEGEFMDFGEFISHDIDTGNEPVGDEELLDDEPVTDELLDDEPVEDELLDDEPVEDKTVGNEELLDTEEDSIFDDENVDLTEPEDTIAEESEEVADEFYNEWKKKYDDEEEEIVIIDENNTLIKNPKKLKNLNKIYTFKELYKTKAPDAKIAKKGEDLKVQTTSKKMSKSSFNVNKAGEHFDSGAKVDTKYFKGMSDKNKKVPTKSKGGDGVENFADFTKRM